MGNVKLTIILFSILGTFACKNQQSKKVDKAPSATKNMPSEKTMIKNPDKTEQKNILVTKILTTSPRYKQLIKGLNKAVVKNGGLSFGVSLEGSPNPGQDEEWNYSKTYDFMVYEMYTDRQLNTARFSFNPVNKQLYEYDAVNDQLKPIEYDRKLLLEYEELCK